MRTGRVRTRLDHHSVLRWATEGSCFFEREWFTVAGEFDPHLGVGTNTPWQAGEIADLLLRGIHNGLPVWFDPSVRVHESAAVVATGAAYRLKARRYARGTGRVARRYFGPTRWARLLIAPLVQATMGLVSGRLAVCLLKLQVLLGRAEGLSGRCLPGGPN
jgi:hypothetical protein